MSDLRKAAEAVLERWDSPAWEWIKQGPTAELMATLRAALAAPSLAVTVDPRLTPDEATAISSALAAPRPEPVAYFDPQKREFYWARPTQIDAPTTVDVPPLPLYAAPPAAAPEPVRHPGYIIGNHWLETAYERVCAGEGEADVLRDCGWERVTDAEALRLNDARYHKLKTWLYRQCLLSLERCRIDSPASYGDWWILRKPKVIDGSSLIGYGKTEDAAIDAAMEDKT